MFLENLLYIIIRRECQNSKYYMYGYSLQSALEMIACHVPLLDLMRTLICLENLFTHQHSYSVIYSKVFQRFLMTPEQMSHYCGDSSLFDEGVRSGTSFALDF